MGTDSIIFVHERDLSGTNEPSDAASSESASAPADIPAAQSSTTLASSDVDAEAATGDQNGTGMTSPTSPLVTASDVLSTNNGSVISTETTPADTGVGGTNNSGTIAAVVISILVILAVIAVLAYFYFRRKRKPQHQGPSCFQPLRKRGSTSDSLRALDHEENNVIHKISDEHRDDDHIINSTAADRQIAEQRDMFTIEDLDDDDAGKGDEYFYDEVFATSQFEDETTKNSVRQLYSTADDMQEEELLDLDFETLGIKIGDHSTTVSRPRPRANNAGHNNI